MKNKKSIHLVSGLALGAVVAAGTSFLYKTQKGKKIRKEFSKYLDDAKTYLPELIKEIKIKAKKLENSLESSNQEIQKKSKTAKKTVSKVISAAKKNVFSKSGQPLVK